MYFSFLPFALNSDLEIKKYRISSLIITVIGKIVVINGYIGDLDISTTNIEIFTSLNN